MFLFKASGATYQSVVDRAIHAFPGQPSGVVGGELVLLSKNRGDCAIDEPQIQFVAKLLRVRRAYPHELDTLFPDVGAGERWKWIAELYWVRALTTPFDLKSVEGLDWRRYKTVQGYARFDNPDAHALLDHLGRTNATVLLDIINNAEPPDIEVKRHTEADPSVRMTPSKLTPPRTLLFFAVTTAGILGTSLGALIGAAFGDLGFIGGGIAVGLLAVFVTIQLLARASVVAPNRRRPVTQGAFVGYLLFAVVAVATMATMIGPIVAVLLIGAGAVMGDYFAADAERMSSEATD